MREHIVGNRHKGVFLNKEFAIFHNDCQTVDIGVNHKSHISLAFLHQRRDGCKVGRYWFGSVTKLAGWVAEQFNHVFNAKFLEQSRDNHAANRVNGIYRYSEVGFTNGFNVNEVKRQHAVDVTTHVCGVGVLVSEAVDIGILKFLGFGNAKHLFSLSIVEEFAVAVEQLQGVPLLRVVRSSEDDAAASVLGNHSKLGGWSGGLSNVYDIKSHAGEGANHHLAHHFAREARIATHNDGV